jgi:HTH-type transcriptional regulator / antitoxin HigA
MTYHSYHELIREFPLRPIRSDRQLDRASRIAFRLAARQRLSRDERDYLDVLSDLIEKYEDEHHSIDPALSGRQALAFLVEENGLTLSQLASETGIQVSTLSEILNGKRSLSLKHVERLCAYFRVEPGLFVHPANSVAAPR